MGKYVIKQSANGGCSFTLVARNGQVVGTSEHYSSDKSCANGIDSVKRNAPVANLEDQTVEGFVQAKNPKFEVYKDKKGEFRFRLKATNGEIILVSEGYTAKASCLKGIQSVRDNADSEIK